MRYDLMRAVSGAAVAAVVLGCASTYNPPRTQKQELTESIDAPKDKIFKVAAFVLRRSGFRFAFADQEEGRITTRPKTMKLTERDCDCGAARGMAFSSTQHTNTDVSYFVLAKDRSIALRCVIDGQYVASDTSMVKRFECVSRGQLEKDMMEKIIAGIAESALSQSIKESNPLPTEEGQPSPGVEGQASEPATEGQALPAKGEQPETPQQPQ
jgi:hypothetical protein